tara:strand:- start:300 stop:530 length:231 start_codon:yes stop_codon:yes gene_type:complete
VATASRADENTMDFVRDLFFVRKLRTISRKEQNRKAKPQLNSDPSMALPKKRFEVNRVKVPMIMIELDAQTPLSKR